MLGQLASPPSDQAADGRVSSSVLLGRRMSSVVATDQGKSGDCGDPALETPTPQRLVLGERVRAASTAWQAATVMP
jgi:hypothetical protein